MPAVRKALGILVSLIALAGVLVTGVLATRRIDVPIPAASELSFQRRET